MGWKALREAREVKFQSRQAGILRTESKRWTARTAMGLLLQTKVTGNNGTLGVPTSNATMLCLSAEAAMQEIRRTQEGYERKLARLCGK